MKAFNVGFLGRGWFIEEEPREAMPFDMFRDGSRLAQIWQFYLLVSRPVGSI
jgi:hypothetical protein